MLWFRRLFPREVPEDNPVLKFERSLNLNKTDYHGKQFEGNQCQEFIKEKNLEKLEGFLVEDEMPKDLILNFIDTFRNHRKVYSACCRTKVDPQHRAITNSFKISYMSLVNDERVHLSIPNKAHFIMDHFSDYFEDSLTGGEGLGTTTDQIIEHCHSYIDRIFRKSR